jgi:uncharacterized protein YhbP (UPF0306 family)
MAWNDPLIPAHIMSSEELLATNLLSTSTMTLATTGVSGEIHAAPVYFVADESLQLYFFSDPESQHARDITRRPAAAVAFYPECFSWEDIRGVQMRGEVYLVEPGMDWDRAWKLYQSKFPFVSALKEIVAQNAMYTFTPNWVRLVDNQRGFGFKQEWTLP